MIRIFQQRAHQQIAGFQSPAEDYLEGRLNITERLVVDPENTHYALMEGEDMVGHNIQRGDLLVIDRSLKLVPGAIAVFSRDGVFYTRRFDKQDGHPMLFTDTEVQDAHGLLVFGVVIASCRGHLPPALRRGRYSHVCTL